MKAIHCACLTRSVDAIRELAKHLRRSTRQLSWTVCARKRRTAAALRMLLSLWEDAENLVHPVLPAPIFSTKARQLALDVKYLSSLGDYCNQRVQLLDGIQAPHR